VIEDFRTRFGRLRTERAPGMSIEDLHHRARRSLRRPHNAHANEEQSCRRAQTWLWSGKPTRGLEPRTPSLREAQRAFELILTSSSDRRSPCKAPSSADGT
jgi:hypothetical protein